MNDLTVDWGTFDLRRVNDLVAIGPILCQTQNARTINASAWDILHINRRTHKPGPYVIAR